MILVKEIYDKPPEASPLDDPALQQLFTEAITRAYMKGVEGRHYYEYGHWLWPFWRWGIDARDSGND